MYAQHERLHRVVFARLAQQLGDVRCADGAAWLLAHEDVAGRGEHGHRVAEDNGRAWLQVVVQRDVAEVGGVRAGALGFSD